jgi:hypothetical protein
MNLVLRIGGLDAKLLTLLCKEITVAKAKEVKTGWSNSQELANVTESSKEDYGSKRAVFPTMITMMMIVYDMTLYTIY